MKEACNSYVFLVFLQVEIYTLGLGFIASNHGKILCIPWYSYIKNPLCSFGWELVLVIL